MPIQLLSFNAVKNNQQVDCKWSTAIEVNNDYFTIERSLDAMNFSPIGEIDGAGNSNLVLNYLFTDYNPHSGINYYRLRQTDFDGQSTLSEIKAVNMDVKNEVKLLSAYFIENELHFMFNQNVKVEEIKLFDVAGREVYHSNYNNKDIMMDNILMDNITSGNYLVFIRANNSEFISKIFR